MRKKILMHFLTWICVVAIEVIIYWRYWNKSTTEGFFIKYSVLITTFYTCYFTTIYWLKKKRHTFELSPGQKVIIIAGVTILYLLFNFYFDFYLRNAPYGLSIGIYSLSRAWACIPVLYGVVTMLEKQNGTCQLTKIKKQYNELISAIGSIEVLRKEKHALEKEIELLRVNNTLANLYYKSQREEHQLAQARYERLIKRLNNRRDNDLNKEP